MFTSPAVLQIKNISKTFAGHPVLKDINLTLASRQTHVLIGSSGAGKSTLLRIILGLEKADTGSIEIDGVTLNDEMQSQWAKRIGYVPQDSGLFPHLTNAANATLVARTLHWPSQQIRKRLEDLRAIVGLEADLLGQYPAQLSGGQRQRVAVMRAAFLDPTLMLLDEPLGALDPLLRAEMQDQLKNIFNRLGKTVVLVTHDIGEAAFFGHSITLLHQGSVVQTGEIADFLKRPATAFVTRFIQAQRTLREVSQWVT